MSRGLEALRRFSSRPPAGRCELCAAPLAAAHPHLLESERRRVACSCDNCAALFPGPGLRFRRLPTRVRALERLEDALWDALDVPIGLAYFCPRPDGSAAGYYPSPAGPVESLLPLPRWQAISAAHPLLAAIEPELEALLVRREREKREQYIVPVDRCFKLIGLVRANWSGMSGGAAVKDAVEGFFAELRAEAERS